MQVWWLALGRPLRGGLGAQGTARNFTAKESRSHAPQLVFIPQDGLVFALLLT